MTIMDVLKSILNLFNAKMETPTPYGWFHLLFWAITVAVALLLCVFHKRNDPDRVRRIVLITSIFVIVLEVYKQINYTFSVSDGVIKGDFQWYAFPFQFCSMPMYTGLLAGIIKRGKIHDALCTFLATYALFAGACVMFYPADVFIGTIGINIQTMICHGSMVSIGVYLLYSGHVRLKHKTMLGGIAVFSICVTTAMILNEVIYYSGILGGETFNMFFVSRHFDGTLPVYSSVQNVVPFPFCLIIYIAMFSLAAYVILLAAMGIKALVDKKKTQKKAELALR